MKLSPTDLARVKLCTDRYYPSLSPFLRNLFNAQLLESRDRWEVEDTLERIMLTAQWYEDGSGKIKVARRRQLKRDK